MEEKQISSALKADGPKREWEAPTIEELDFTATEASYIPGAPIDFGIYTF
jgi:hypothetical protein